jgi:hypothetical protein
MSYELTAADSDLLVKVRKAVEYENNGDPMRDVIDRYEIIDALALLVRLTDTSFAVQGDQP